jgi:aspartyl-tRNA(Asn)/glutamyl-tRNA(Gln) amidotransferase subunit A
MDVTSLSIKQTHNGLKNKEFSAQELTESYLQRINERNNDVQAFITVMDDEAVAQAKAVDKKIAEGGELHLLEGVPCAIKDNILIEDVRATGGSHILEKYKAVYDATVVNKLKRDGAVFLGKANMDEFAMGGSGETSHYNATKNPVDMERVPGGSSSGSAAAVADDQCVYALGSDTGGSIRQPASFCGLVGLKPTYGAVSRYGLMAMASGFDQIGPLTRTVEDAAYVYEAIAGADPFDGTTVKHDVNVLDTLDEGVKGLTFGIPKEYFTKGLDPEVEKAVLESINKLRDLGANVKEVSLPHTKYGLSTYYILMPAEVSSNLARYDGVRYGHREDAGNLVEMYLKTRKEGFGDEVKRRIMLGTFVLSAGYVDAYYKKAQQVRTLIKRDFEKVFEDVDCILAPTTPTTAFKLGEKVDDPLTMYLSDIFTVTANVAGIPAVSVPSGTVGNLPVGLQIMGAHFDEAMILRVARALETNA